MRLTLLELVQDIMNDLEGDEIASITETVESTQVAQIVKTCYMEMMANRNWPHMKQLFRCTEAADSTTPTFLTIPTDIKEV